MRRPGVIRADGLPETARALIFLPQQPGGGIRIDAAITEYGVRCNAHRGQLVKMNGVDLKRPDVPCAVPVAQGFPCFSAFRGENGEERGDGHSADVGGVQNTVSRQRTQGRENDSCPFSGKGRIRQQPQSGEKKERRSHLSFPVILTL